LPSRRSSFLTGVSPGAPEGAVIVDKPVANVTELRVALQHRLPRAVLQLQDKSLNIILNDGIVLGNEENVAVQSGDEITIRAMLGGG
jgi:aldehyde:ferredoxin oxidoreductase